MVSLSLLVYLVTGVRWLQAADLADLGFVVISLAGLFGFAYRRALASRTFWRAWLPIQVLWSLTIALVLAPAGLAYQFPGAEATSILDNALGLIFVVPLYAALYLYGYRSPDLWPAA